MKRSDGENCRECAESSRYQSRADIPAIMLHLISSAPAASPVLLRNTWDGTATQSGTGSLTRPQTRKKPKMKVGKNDHLASKRGCQRWDNLVALTGRLRNTAIRSCGQEKKINPPSSERLKWEQTHLGRLAAQRMRPTVNPPPPLLQQAARVFISTACKNSAWPSSALLSRTRCALRAFAGGDSSAWLRPPRERCTHSIWLTNFTVPRRGEHSPADFPPHLPHRSAAGEPAESRDHRSQTLFYGGRLGSHCFQTTLDALAGLRKRFVCRLGWSFGFSPNEVLFSAACFMQPNWKVG